MVFFGVFFGGGGGSKDIIGCWNKGGGGWFGLTLYWYSGNTFGVQVYSALVC